ncbi:glutamyl-tRNA synthetase [Zychaea mexicana]|uniref:glutamyl-tRNA synthetase n=1 Tax=Zychaea mexicana TaxID=64656 RepID=UPI0022FEEC0F|nr:glutamyl-tRNA synthetase [Zychaea mexicana]KAI9491651.1 glutamyl-tRNA synthetase [Zychaea mexicana]
MLVALSTRIAFPRQRSWIYNVRRCCTTTTTTTARQQQPVRVRFAPSPTGYLHLGGLRTALFNYLLAKKTGGDFILRIEDTDQNRLVKGATEKLISVLSWAGVEPDEGPTAGGSKGPYVQSERTDIYREHAQQLIENGHAYRCFCTPERIDRIRQVGLKHGNQIGYDRHCAHLSDKEINENMDKKLPFTVRMRTPEGETKVNDLVHGQVRFNNRLLDDGILLKSDGFPTYHLANVVDDHMMGITHVLRGDEWLPSTPKHLILYKAFGWKTPHFAHLPLLMKPGGGKLSKRSNDAFVEHYINKGYFPEALNNFVALLGWSPPAGENEIITTLDALVDKFDIKSLNDSQAVVDADKLGWINKQHLIKRAETAEGILSMANYLQPIVHSTFSRRCVSDYIGKVIDAVKERIRVIHDVPELCEYFFIEPDYTTEDANKLKKKLKNKPKDIVFSDAARQGLESLETFDTTAINKYWHDLAASHDVDYNRIMPVLRFAMTGKGVGTSIPLTMEVLGKSTCLARLDKARDFL